MSSNTRNQVKPASDVANFENPSSLHSSTSFVWFVEDSPEPETSNKSKPSEQPSAIEAAVPLTRAQHEQSQRADQPRLPWIWGNRKASGKHDPTIQGKWWSRSQVELDKLSPDYSLRYAHVARIMETELGQQLFNTDRCSYCQLEGYECWVYSEQGSKQVRSPNGACARCRATPHKGGCSKATRRPHVKPTPPPPGARILAPYKPLQGQLPLSAVAGNTITAVKETRVLRKRPQQVPASIPSSSQLPPPSRNQIETIARGTGIPSIDLAGLILLRKKQKQLSLNETVTLSALPNEGALQNAMAATFIFAQYEAGTAVCIDEAGWILTCAHCFGDSEEEYKASSKRKWLLSYNGLVVLAECKVWDPKRDLALLRIVAVESNKPNSEEIPTFSSVKLNTRPLKSKMSIFCIGQPGRDDLESTSQRKTKYNLIEVSKGKFRGMVIGVDPQDNSDIGTLKHDAWTYWGHSGAPLLSAGDGTLIGLHSSWDDETAMRHGIPYVAIKEFLQKEVPADMKLLMPIDIAEK